MTNIKKPFSGMYTLDLVRYKRYNGLADLHVYDELSFSGLESAKEMIQGKPTSYIPSLNAEGCIHIIFELIDNHIDELIAEGSCGDTLNATYDKSTHEFMSNDNGRGVPHSVIFNTLTKINFGAKLGNSKFTAYQESGGTNGTGWKLAAYLTDYLKVRSMRDGQETTIEFENGDVVKHDVVKHKGKSGTVNIMKFSKRFFPKFKEVNPQEIRKILEQKSYMHPKVKMNFAILKDGAELESYRYYGKDIEDWIIAQKPDTPVFRIKGMANHPKNKKPGKIDIVFAFKEDLIDVTEDEATSHMISYANGIQTTLGGFHLTATKTAIIKYFRKQIYDKMKPKEREQLTISGADLINGLVCFVDVRLNEPVFRAQHKDRLEVEWVGELVESFMISELKQMKDKDIQATANFLKNIVKARNEAKKIRTAKKPGNAFSADRIEKYIPYFKTIKTTWPEFHIVEGDSAKTNIKPILDVYNQAIFQLTGKTDNFLDDTPADIMSESGKGAIRDLYRIMEGYPGRKFDIEKLKMLFQKIIFDTDADTDGDDMFITVVSALAKFNPELIHAGMIYRSLIPLYSFKDGGKEIYLPTQKDLVKFILKKFMVNHDVYDGKKEIAATKLFDLIIKNYKYSDVVEDVSKAYKVDASIMESIAYHFSEENMNDLEYWKKWAKENLAPSIEVQSFKGKIQIVGINGMKPIYLIFNKPFRQKLKKIKRYHDGQSIYGFRIDDKKTNMSLYELVSLVRSYQPNNITRYKGVGEFEAKDLKAACFNPKTRILMQVKFSNNQADDMDVIHLLKSGKKEYSDRRGILLQTLDVSDIEIDT